MASRVNLKFVFLLGGAMVLLATAVVWIGLKNYMPGGEQNIERGKKEEAAGDLKKAIMYYGRAVNKDRGNLDWINTWLAAIEKYTPPDRQAYQDVYQGEYMGALHALADADRRNVAYFKRYIDERYQARMYQRSSLQVWETFDNECKDLLTLFQGDDAGRKELEGYRGLAIAGQFASNTDLDDSKVNKGVEFLTEAIKLDPKNRDTVLALNSIRRIQADKAARASHQAEADRILAATHKDLEDYVKAVPDDTRVRLSLLEADMAAGAHNDGKETVLELLQRNKAAIGGLADAVMALPPEKTDYVTAIAIAPWVGVAVDDGMKRADALLEHVRKGHANDAGFLLRWAQFEMSRGNIDKAIALEQQVVALPDVPMSLSGLLLHTFRIRAVQLQADAWFARTQTESDPAKKAEAIQKVKDLRKDLASRVGDSDTSVLALDGRIDYLNGDLSGARTRISRYNDQTQQTDADMVMLEAQLLNQLGQKGAAKAKYQRVLSLQKQNVRALAALGLIEFADRDWAAAANHLGLASAMLPSDQRLKELADNASKIVKGDKSDKVLEALLQADQVGTGVTGDVQKSITILRDALAQNPDDLRLVMALAMYMAAAKDVDGAKALLADAIKRNPDNKGLKSALERLEKNPLDLVLEHIDQSNATDLQKHLARFNAYIQLGKADDARKELDAAARSDPNDIGVINAQFDDALIRKDTAEQDRLIAKARQLNLDKVGGDLFYARALMNRGKTTEAVGILTDIKGKDKLNLMAWRLLGLALFDQHRFVESADALKTAVSIKPDDVLSIDACLHAMISAGQLGDALAMARKCEDVAVTNPDFFETYLSLEAEAPGGDKAKAIEARQNLAKRNPDNRGNMTRLCSLLINSGNTADAEQLIAGLLKSDPNDPVAVQLKAACLGRQGKVADAVQFLQDFIASRKPEDRTVELYVNTGRLMIQLGQPDAAIKLLTDNRSAQNPRKPGEKQSALIDRELGDMKYNLASSASSKAEYKQYLDAALASYQAVLDSGSEDEGSMVRKRMVEVCLKAEYFDKMNQIIAQLPQAVQNDPTLILLQAEAAAAQGQKDKALRLYDQAVAADNQNPIVYLKRGDFKSLDPATLKDSLADYEQMKRVDKNSVIARVRMARVLRMMGRDEEAVRAVKEAITIDPFNESMRLALALMLREIGKNTEAAQAMEDAVTQFEGAKQWRMGAAQYWARVGRWDKAVEHMRAVWKDDQSVDVAIPLVEYLINSGDVTNAYNVLQSSAIASKVNDSLPLRLLRARVYAKTGRNTDAAQEIADSVSRVRPESLEEASLFIAGVANLYPDVNEQTGVLDRLEKTRPFTGFLALKAAEVRLRNTSTHDAAIATLQALTDNPRVDEKVAAKVQARAWSLLGTDSYARKNWNEAHDRFEKGQKLDPTNAELNNNLAYILATKLNRCKEALPFAKEACRLVPNKSDFLDTLGAAQVGAQLCDDAAKTLNLGIQAALNDAERIPLYIHMGKARLCQGDRIEARRVASVALDMMSRLPDVRTQYQPDWDDLDKSINAN